MDQLMSGWFDEAILGVLLSLIAYFLRDLHNVVKVLVKAVTELQLSQERNKSDSKEKDAAIMGEIKSIEIRLQHMEKSQSANSAKFREIYKSLNDLQNNIAKLFK